MNDPLYMSAEEAADALNVSVATVYAYVSRGILRSHKIPGVRAARYWRADVERVLQKAPAGHHRIDSAPLVTETTITMITEAGPYYRGRSAIALAEAETIESVAALLWQADESVVFPPSPPPAADLAPALWTSLADVSSIDRAASLFPLIERSNPRAYDLSPAGFARTGGEVMRWFAAILAGLEGPSAAPIHEVVVSRSKADPRLEDVVRRLLVLAADHELDPTTYAVRAAANTGVTPYRAVIAGLTASTGRRLTLGRPEMLARLLEEIIAAPDARDPIVRRLREGDPVPGFGSPFYKSGDPRGAAMLDALNTALSGDRELKKLNDAIAGMHEITGEAPNFALTNLFVARKLGPVPQYGVTLRLGRTAGWIAHALEQYHQHDLVRTRAAYTGELPREFGAEVLPAARGGARSGARGGRSR